MSFAARENLKRTLEYRPHIKKSYRGLLIFAAIGELIVFALTINALMQKDPVLALGIFVAGQIPVLLLFLEAHFLARPMASAKVHVRPDGLTLERLGKSIEIHFSDIKEVKFSHVPYLGGWFKLILQNGQTYRFTVVLERSEYILEALSAVRPGVVRSQELMSYRRTALMADHSWARVYSKFSNWQGLILKYAALPTLMTVITAVVFYVRADALSVNGFLKAFTLIAALNLAVGLTLTFAISELAIVLNGRERILADPTAVLRDIPFEKRTEMIALIGHWIFALSLLAYTLVQYPRY